MKKIIIALIINIFFITFSYANNQIQEIITIDLWEQTKFTNSELYIPTWPKIINQKLRIISWKEFIFNDNSWILKEFKNKIWEEKVNDLIEKNLIYILWNYEKKLLLWNESSIKIEEKETLKIINEIIFDTESLREKLVLKYYPINKEKAWYSWIREINNNFPKIFLFDEVLLPQNLQINYSYIDVDFKKSQDIVSSKSIEVLKKYENYKLKIWDNISYVILPYYEFEIPFNLSNPTKIYNDTLIISYDIINQIQFYWYWTEFLIDENFSPLKIIRE